MKNQFEDVRELKNSVVKKQKYEEAAKLRDDEKHVEKDLAIAQEQWEEEFQKQPNHALLKTTLPMSFL